jgi:hypothetical protein
MATGVGMGGIPWSFGPDGDGGSASCNGTNGSPMEGLEHGGRAMMGSPRTQKESRNGNLRLEEFARRRRWKSS